MNASAKERLSRLEAVLPHLATKADIAEVKGEIKELKGSFRILLLLATATLAILNIALRFVGN